MSDTIDNRVGNYICPKDNSALSPSTKPYLSSEGWKQLYKCINCDYQTELPAKGRTIENMKNLGIKVK